MQYQKLFGVFCIAIFLSFSALAQGQSMMDPVQYRITEAPDKVEVGQQFQVKIKATIEGKWHLYSVNNDPDAGPKPTKFSSKNDHMTISGEVEESEPQVSYDPNFDAELGWHNPSATFTVPVTFGEGASAEETVSLEVRYQVCDDKSCLPPRNKTIEKTVQVIGGGASTGAESNTSEPAETDSASASVTEAGTGGDSGIFSFFWIALTAGFAALLTPCVFPMIPLTVSFFSKDGDGDESGGHGVARAFQFGFAIIVTFTLLGVILSLLLGASGANQFAANPWVNIFIGLVLVVFAFSLLGAFELRLPHQFTNWLNRKSNESSGLIGVLFMALTISAVSFSCTAPFVGGVLAATAGGEWFYPVIGMVGFSAAFASPFILFAIFPKWLESLPQSGSWMNIVKVILGYIELAAAIKFISNADLVWQWEIVTRPFAIAAWIAIFLLTGFYLLGFYSIHQESTTNKIGTTRLMLALPFILFSFYLVPGLLGSSLGIWDAWLPPKQATDVSVVYSITQAGGMGQQQASESGFENWSSDYEKSMAKARQENRPVFIDFTGYTCTNCRAMETNVFPAEEVQKYFSKMEKVKLYTDDETKGKQNRQLQLDLVGSLTLPTYVIVDPASGNVISQLEGYTEKKEFTEFLDRGLEKYNERNT